MRLSHLLTRFAVFVFVALVCTFAARATVRVVEDVSVTSVREELVDEGLAWASVLGDGLQLVLEGQAPSEASRFRAMSTAGRVVDASRVIDNMTVAESDAIEAPDFAIEILRNDSGISIIGLIPTSSDRESLANRLAAIAGDAEVADFLETADYPAPPGWRGVTDYAIRALRLLPRAKISVSAEQIEITATADSPERKSELEAELARNAPSGVARAISITAPRPVISPYTVRFTRAADGSAEFDACAADGPEPERQIISAATAAGFEGRSPCVQALGAPSSQWADAVSTAIEALGELDGGTVTIADADVTLQGLETTDAETFERVAGELENALPEVFALATNLPRPVEQTPAGPPTFTVTRSPEGAVQLRGGIEDDLDNVTAENYAAAKFGASNVTMGTRITEGLPQGWSVRVLAGIEALAQLSQGSVIVRPDSISVRGKTGQVDAPTIITTLLIDKLGPTEEADLDIEYVEALDPTTGLPTPQECVDQIGVVTQGRKILFDPGSASLTSDSQAIMDDIAEILQKCPDIPLQIAGYTDSQGRETMNQQLSQDRANAVLDALRVRRVPISAFTAEGFGEADPIADNDTADGREANRRIEFSLLERETEEEQTGLEQMEAEAAAEGEADTETSAADDPDAEIEAETSEE
ncbi:OmpA family protein [Salipiger sp. IMCC34102]|uniref:OmpA family protein n=1 Tax=Salipiger sp. IMCC34102 TaxID=2510647 RepID=UPI00101DDBB3|nr:OmpA family protein [Salipiger sp. IMCC34102]RYH01628.1 OmpA family protein [Salipiger sp. IMCC34102]